MRRLFCLFFLVGSAYAQQQVTPADFSASQTRLFKKITEAVSTPCCQNGIPVAYHASGMAQVVRDDVARQIREGKSEDDIMAALAEMRFGPKNDMEIIFTVPDKNLLGSLSWWIGVIILLALIWMMKVMLTKEADETQVSSDDELLDKYRDYIATQMRETN